MFGQMIPSNSLVTIHQTGVFADVAFWIDVQPKWVEFCTHGENWGTATSVKNSWSPDTVNNQSWTEDPVHIYPTKRC